MNNFETGLLETSSESDFRFQAPVKRLSIFSNRVHRESVAGVHRSNQYIMFGNDPTLRRWSVDIDETNESLYRGPQEFSGRDFRPDGPLDFRFLKKGGGKGIFFVATKEEFLFVERGWSTWEKPGQWSTWDSEGRLDLEYLERKFGENK